jgi:hypothetical protein
LWDEAYNTLVQRKTPPESSLHSLAVCCPKSKLPRQEHPAGDFWGGFAAMLVALLSAIAFGVTITGVVLTTMHVGSTDNFRSIGQTPVAQQGSGPVIFCESRFATCRAQVSAAENGHSFPAHFS